MVVYGEKPKLHVQKKLVVKTKNSVPDETIQNHITYAKSYGLEMIQECGIHHNTAVLVSGGPSYKEHLEEIREHQRNGDFIVCVKTSHDTLIEEGIIPWACVLLDPRDHVLDFVEKPHHDVTYITATQVHPKTLNRLLGANARIELIIEAFGGVQAMAKLMSCSPSTIYNWKRLGRIPVKRYGKIVEVAEENGIETRDFTNVRLYHARVGAGEEKASRS